MYVKKKTLFILKTRDNIELEICGINRFALIPAIAKLRYNFIDITQTRNDISHKSFQVLIPKLRQFLKLRKDTT